MCRLCRLKALRARALRGGRAGQSASGPVKKIRLREKFHKLFLRSRRPVAKKHPRFGGKLDDYLLVVDLIFRNQ
jgi:hypothetical protein